MASRHERGHVGDRYGVHGNNAELGALLLGRGNDETNAAEQAKSRGQGRNGRASERAKKALKREGAIMSRTIAIQTCTGSLLKKHGELVQKEYES
jgi:hypothetical protein